MGNKTSSNRRRSEGSTGIGVGSKVNSKDVTGSDQPAVRVIKRSSAILPPTSNSNNNSVRNSNQTRKLVSCPDLKSGGSGGGVVANSAKPPDFMIYRSYTNVSDTKRRSSQTRPDIRVYKRSATGLCNGDADQWYSGGEAGGRVLGDERSQTLPRGFGRSKSSAAAPNDTISLTLPRSTQQYDLNRHSSLGYSSGTGFGSEIRGSRRSASTTSMASIGYKVNLEDFPDTVTIKRRLAQFETVFTRSLALLYSQLPQSVQLSTLSIAVRPNRANQHVSLLQYLNGADVPLDLLAPDWQTDTLDDDNCYILTIQPAMFSGVMHLRKDRPTDQTAAVSLAGELVACLAAEAAGELARIFEYQLALLPEGLTIELVASHAAHCVLDFLRRTGRHLERNTIVHGVLHGQHIVTTGVIPRLSVIIGQRELKWKLHEIFKKPGLRKETFLFTNDVVVDEDHGPWQFLTSYLHDPMLYGYRSLVIDWDYDTCTSSTTGPQTGGLPGYRLNGQDEASFPDVVDWRPDDFHRTYLPYRRLVGSAVVNQFNRLTAGRGRETASMAHSASLAEFVNKLQGDVYSRDVIQVVFRPIGDTTVDCLVANELDDDAFVTSHFSYVTDGVRRGVKPQQVAFPVDQAIVLTNCPPVLMTSPATTEVVVTVAPSPTSLLPAHSKTPEVKQPEIVSNQLETDEVTSDESDDVINVTVISVDNVIGLDRNRNNGHLPDVMKQEALRDDVTKCDVTRLSDDAGYFICESNRRTIRSDL